MAGGVYLHHFGPTLTAIDLNKTDHLLRSISLEFVCQFSNPRKAGFEWISPITFEFGKSNKTTDVLDFRWRVTADASELRPMRSQLLRKIRDHLFPDPFGESS